MACKTKSALDRNLKASANSRKPSTTFTEFNQPPDCGKLFSQDGNAAKRPKGRAKPIPNPNIPTVSALAPPSDDSTLPRSAPNNGPVHEKLTRTKTIAIKNIPMKPPTSDALSALFIQLEGSVISNAPKKLMAKTMKMTKKNRFR